MTWETTTATFRILGRDETVLRPAFTMEFYGGDELLSHGPRLFEKLHGLVPEGTPLHVIGKKGVEYKPLTPRRLSRLRKTMETLATDGQFYAIKDAEGFEVGGYSIELHLSEWASSRVMVALPLSFVQGREQAAYEVFEDFVATFPFHVATAGYGFHLEWAREGEMAGEPVEIRAGLRFHGLMMRNRMQESFLRKQLKSAHWLTFVHDTIAADLGGSATFEGLDGVDTTAVSHGVLLRAGEAPPVGDTESHAPDLAPMKAVNDALRAIRIVEWTEGCNTLYRLDAQAANGWLTRMDTP